MCPFVLVLNVWPNLHSFKYIWFFFTYLTELNGLSVAKSSYCDELSVAKSSNMLSVAKSWTVELSVAKDDVHRCIHITTASLATAGVRRYSL
jgi:hypothetical protein